MSQESVEIVRGVYDAFARHDNRTPFEVYAEDIVLDLSKLSAVGVEPIYHGHEGVRQYWRDVLSVSSEVHLEVEELIDAGDRVVAVTRASGVGRVSGVPLGTIRVSVWTLAGGKVVRMEVFDDRRQAFEAAGLRE
jgi:ketosteroid isomerase-like protein